MLPQPVCLYLSHQHGVQLHSDLGQRRVMTSRSFNLRPASSSSPSIVFFRCQVYIGHEGWPRSGGECIGDGGVLEILAAWARSTIEISVLLARAGGSPEGLCHYSKAHVGLLAAVVPVHDEYLATEWDSKIKFKRG